MVHIDSSVEDKWSNEVTQIVGDFMRKRLSKRGYLWPEAPASPASTAGLSQRQRIGQALNLIADAMLSDNENKIRDILARAVTLSILDYESFRVIADEMFTEGIQWSHIVMLLLFGSELAFELGTADGRSNDASDVSNWLVRYFSSSASLKDWVHSHGHWNGLIEYAGLSDRSISKSMLLLAVGSVATVALATVIHFFVKA